MPCARLREWNQPSATASAQTGGGLWAGRVRVAVSAVESSGCAVSGLSDSRHTPPLLPCCLDPPSAPTSPPSARAVPESATPRRSATHRLLTAVARLGLDRRRHDAHRGHRFHARRALLQPGTLRLLRPVRVGRSKLSGCRAGERGRSCAQGELHARLTPTPTLHTLSLAQVGRKLKRWEDGHLAVRGGQATLRSMDGTELATERLPNSANLDIGSELQLNFLDGYVFTVESLVSAPAAPAACAQPLQEAPHAHSLPASRARPQHVAQALRPQFVESSQPLAHCAVRTGACSQSACPATR